MRVAPQVVLAMITFVIALSASAQEPSIEYGQISELKGVERFFVDAGEDLDLRDIIKAVLVKELGVTIVERPEDAEHVIAFRWWDGGAVWRCRATVAKRIGPDRLRLLSSRRATEAELNDLADEYAKWLAKQIRRLENK